MGDIIPQFSLKKKHSLTPPLKEIHFLIQYVNTLSHPPPLKNNFHKIIFSIYKSWRRALSASLLTLGKTFVDN
jgi:hypothetical protein